MIPQARFFCIPLICMVLGLSGCISDSSICIQSAQSGMADTPRLPIGAYIAENTNSATVYLTDLDSAALDPGTDLAGVSGRIVQINMFLRPAVGSTPMATTACSATVRHIILANGNIGVYSGGGFLSPSGHVGDPKLSGTLKGATMRLSGSYGSFVDRLGAATMRATFTAQRDEALAKRIAARVDDVLLKVGETNKPKGEAGK